MIGLLIFLLIPSGGIAAGKYAHLWGFTYMEVPAYAFENDIVKINCSQNISSNEAQFLTLKSGSSPIIKVTQSVDKAQPAMWNKDFTVMAGSNGTHIYTEVKAQCKHTNIYFCVNQKIITAFFNNHRLEVIKKVMKPHIEERCRNTSSCVSCENKNDSVKCVVGASFPNAISFAWYYRTNILNSWTRIINGISVGGLTTELPYTSKNCRPAFSIKWSFLNTNKLLVDVDIYLKCEVNFILGNLHQKSYDIRKVCGRFARHYMEGPTVVYENQTLTLTCVNAGAPRKKKVFAIERYNENSFTTQTIGKVAYQGSNRSLPNKFEFYGFKAVQDNSTERLTVQKIAQCTDTNSYGCVLDGKLSSMIDVRVLKRPTLQLNVPNDICAEGNQHSKNACHTCDHVIIKNLFSTITVHCQTNVSLPPGTPYGLSWYYKHKGSYWQSLGDEDREESGELYKFKECSQLTSFTFNVTFRPIWPEFTLKCILRYITRHGTKTSISYSREAEAEIDICIKHDYSDLDDYSDLGAIPRWGKLDTKIILGMASITLIVWVAVFILFNLIRRKQRENRGTESHSDGKLGENNEQEQESMTSKPSLRASVASVDNLKRSHSDLKRSQSTKSYRDN